ncbi:hypothetical protein EYF80_022684 [Liparis tanakae]|uniref:Uncharacterized protein n=1 Tax=Liparis tanakae TaxID=230148 RepID=A0A4Z2HQA3_9TELE|nr:hypothetical protein EYF80_022684 [Liparis tanakae]
MAKKREMMEGERERERERGGGGGPVKHAARCQRLTGLQRPAVHGELHDAAHEVVGGDLTAALEEGLDGADAGHREPERNGLVRKSV